MPTGWVQLPFYASKNAASDVYPEWDFDGFSANSFAQGASGVLGIPTPPDATKVRQIRIAGKIVKGEITITFTRSRVGEGNRQLMQETIQSEEPLTVDVKKLIEGNRRGLTKDDTLTISIRAKEGPEHRTHILFAAVEFQRSGSY